MTKIFVETGLQKSQPDAGTNRRLPSFFTAFALRNPGAIQLDLSNQDTLSLALPELLANARLCADEIMSEMSENEQEG